MVMKFVKHIPSRLLLCLVCLVQSGVADESRPDAQDHVGPLELPDIVRYEQLPTRLLLRQEFARAEVTEIVPESYVQFFTRLLDGDYDNELHRDVAQCLERVGRLKLAKPETYVDSLKSRLKTSDSRIVTRACAIALAAANHPESAEDLARFCQPDNEIVCAHAEPKIAEWDSAILLETWRTRINNPATFSDQLVILACQCLSKINDTPSAEALISLATDETIQFPVRQAAADAVGKIDPAKAAALSEKLASGKILQRLLAVTLLKNAASAQARSRLADLCDDPENATAAIAWHALAQLDNSLLTKKLEQGITHPEPNVRKIAVKILKDVPSKQHNTWLNELLRDAHIEVRNLARSALSDVATANPKMRQQIVNSAGRNLTDSLSNWQQIEQSLILLGQMRHPDFQTDCISLLTHPRNEVMVSAAWLLHLMPREPLAKEITAIAYQQFETIKKNRQSWAVKDPARLNAFSHQLKFLFHVAGYQRQKQIRDLADEMFSKSAPTIVETRSAGLWALGMAYANTDDKDLQKKWANRLHDDNAMEPEWDMVKAASALSLGIQGMESSIEILELAHKKYGIEGEIGLAVSSSLRMFGKNPPTPKKLPLNKIGNWPVSPFSN